MGDHGRCSDRPERPTPSEGLDESPEILSDQLMTQVVTFAATRLAGVLLCANEASMSELPWMTHRHGRRIYSRKGPCFGATRSAFEEITGRHSHEPDRVMR